MIISEVDRFALMRFQIHTEIATEIFIYWNFRLPWACDSLL